MWPTLIDAAILIGTPVVRSIAGWAGHSLEDGTIDKFELKELGSTIIRVGTIGVFTYIGFSVIGVDNAALAAGVASFLMDKLFSSLKKNKTVK